jgi:hypothetical protein
LRTNKPRWHGESLQGKTILLQAEQGYGDTLQFSRYVTLLAELGGSVIVQAPAPLHTLLASIKGIKKVVSSGSDFDCHCPLLSVPRALSTLPDEVPADIPYLTANAEKRAGWRTHFSALASTKVGVVWRTDQVKPEKYREFNRAKEKKCLVLEQLSPLLAQQNISLVNLQIAPSPAEQAALAANNVLDISADLHDFSDTAAAISELDLVITIDTSVAHLSGALGRPVWVLLPFSADWRWLLDRDDSPWYPSMRLFRQQRLGDWTSVIKRVAQALARKLH